MIILALATNQTGQLVKTSADVRNHPVELQHRVKIPHEVVRLAFCEQTI